MTGFCLLVLRCHCFNLLHFSMYSFLLFFRFKMQFQIQGGEYVSLFAGALYIECTEWLVSDVHFSALCHYHLF